VLLHPESAGRRRITRSALLESFRRGQRWLTLIFVATVGLVFVFFFGSGGGGIGPSAPTGNAIVELDDVRLTSRDYGREQRAMADQLRRQLGDAYDQIGGDRYVDAQALSSMINTVVLAAAARDLGLHVTKDEVRRIVQSSASFIDAEGRFSPRAFNSFAESEYGTQRAFIQSFTRSLLGQKLIQLLAAQTTVSDAEIDMMTRYEQEQARIAYVALDGRTLPEGETLDGEQVEAWAEENETALRALFNERAPGLATPERVRARHLLIRAASDASEEEIAEARTRTEAARARIESGEPFAAVAEELSEDAATATNGGDLGLIERGDDDPAIDDAAFSLEPGELSGIVRSDYGFHLITVEERQPAKPASWDEQRLVLARERAEAERAAQIASERAERLAAAVRDGASLEDAAREEGLTLERPPAIRRRPDGFVPGLGAAKPLMTAAFALDPGTSSPEVYDVDDRRVLIELLGRTVPDAAALAEAREAGRDQILAQKQNEVVERWLSDYRRQLEASGRLRINAELALGRS
jgi:peptidyl-prolyl cis-trans isomerase D